MSKNLGKWAVIDIETTGIDPGSDSIIDLGYLQFEGTKLIKKFSSLVRYNTADSGDLSQFIQKLTGITPAMLKKAPRWEDVEPDLLELEGHTLLAHNASFEEKFLKKYFEKNNYRGESSETVFSDSLYFLAILFPEKTTLALEHFIMEFSLREKEDHRGFSDALDLLKVVLVAGFVSYQEKEKRFLLLSLIDKYKLDDFWYFKLFSLSLDELNEIAVQIDFNLNEFEIDKDSDLFSSVKSKPTDKVFSSKNIETILKNESGLKEINPGYRYRKGQEQLALKTGQAFKNNIHALIQAPTGTGKTLGYLIPSMLFSHQEKKQVLIATGTKTLQAQAMEKDIPGAYQILGFDKEELKTAQLLGSSNHYCELLFRSHEGELDFLDGLDSFEKKISQIYFEMVFYHNTKNEQDKRLNRGNTAYLMKRILKDVQVLDQELTVDFRACTGNNCPYKNQCSYLQGLRNAKEADIIVGNHALMFAWPQSFPRPAHIIVDEAHKIEGEATTAFSKSVSHEQLEIFYKQLVAMQGVGALFYLLSKDGSEFNAKLIPTIRAEVTSMVEIMMEHMVSLKDQMELYFKKMPRYTAIYWNELPMIKKEGLKDNLGTSIYNHLDSLRFVFANLAKLLTPYMNMFDPKSLKEQNELIAFTRFESFMGQVLEIFDALEAILKSEPDQTNSMRFHEEEGYIITNSPINVGKKIYEGLLQTSASVVFTSATLTNAKGNVGIQGVEWLTGYSYLPSEKRFKGGFFLDPIYDYKNKAKVFLCPDTLSFSNRNFVSSVLNEFIPVIKELKGRTLMLFSSKVRFEEAREIILKNFEGHLPVFIQGMGHNIVEDFKKAGGGILLGMESFGEGIDIPGDLLQLVFIDKIPDLKQELVIKDRRDFFEKNFGNEFNDYFQANRARKLQQKLGRLLRTENDRGSVIIVDSRIKEWKPATLKNFCELMEPYDIKIADYKSACSEALSFIAGD